MTPSNLFLETTPLLYNSALLIGRLFIGVCFIMHALGKLGYVGPGGSMKGFADWLASLKVPMPVQSAYAAMLTEMIGGGFLAIGFLTRPVSLALIFVMFVAGYVGHKGAGYMITNNPPGAEYTINLAVICFMFFLLGAGAYSVDAMLFAAGSD